MVPEYSEQVRRKRVGRGWVVVAVAAVCAIIVGLVVFRIAFPTRSSVEVSELLVPNLPAPSTGPAVEWHVATEMSDEWSSLEPQRSRLWRSWGFEDGDEYGIVRHTVVAYGTSLGARYAARREWAGLLRHPDIPSADASDPFESSLADDSHMICLLAEGVVDECNQWRYVARYGQYTTELSYWSQPISQDEFKMMIAAMEEHVATVLE
jgi:hypothetical protein